MPAYAVRTRQSNAKYSAFTLIELLVVVAIISILAAILFPVFTAARDKARQSACASNLHQIGVAWLQYCQDYDEGTPNVCYGEPCNSWGSIVAAGGAPNGDTYFGGGAGHYTGGHGTSIGFLLYPYVKSVDVWRCPGNPLPAEAVIQAPQAGNCGSDANNNDACYAGGFENSSYAYNFLQFINAAPGNWACSNGQPMGCTTGGTSGTTAAGWALPKPSYSVSLSQVATPSTVGVMFGSWGNGAGFGWAMVNTSNACDVEGASLPGSGTYCISISTNPYKSYPGLVNGHSGGGNCMYADGHVKWYSANWINSQIALEKSYGWSTSSPTSAEALRTPGVTPTVFHD